MTTEASNNARLILAAQALAREGPEEFTMEALAVKAWSGCPQAFGLRGYEAAFPDAHRIYSALCHKNGPKCTGHLELVGPKLYRLTRLGRTFGTEPDVPAEGLVALRGDVARELARWLDGEAAAKFREGNRDGITFADACRLWCVTEATRDPAECLARLDEFLAGCSRLLDERDGLLPGGRVVTAAEVRFLANLHSWAKDKFSRHLKLLQNRGPKCVSR